VPLREAREIFERDYLLSQIRRFGLRTAVPERALSLRHEDGRYVVALDSGDELAARTVVPVPRLVAPARISSLACDPT